MSLAELPAEHDANPYTDLPGLVSSLATVYFHRINIGDEMAAEMIKTYCRTHFDLVDFRILNAGRPVINNWQMSANARTLDQAVRWLRHFGLGVFTKGLDECPAAGQQQRVEAPGYPTLQWGEPQDALAGRSPYEGFPFTQQQQLAPMPYFAPAANITPAQIAYADQLPDLQVPRNLSQEELMYLLYGASW